MNFLNSHFSLAGLNSKLFLLHTVRWLRNIIDFGKHNLLATLSRTTLFIWMGMGTKWAWGSNIDQHAWKNSSLFCICKTIFSHSHPFDCQKTKISLEIKNFQVNLILLFDKFLLDFLLCLNKWFNCIGQVSPNLDFISCVLLSGTTLGKNKDKGRKSFLNNAESM